MFDATKGRAAVTTRIEEKSDAFAANFEDRLNELTLDEREALIDHLNAVVNGTDVAKSFASGTYAQSKDGSPARALGAGTPAAIEDNDAINALLASNGLSDGIKNALRRILVPSDPGYLPVENDGTPAGFATRDRQIATLTAERDTAQADLDPSKSGSTAHKLAAHENGTTKAEIKAEAKKAKDALATAQMKWGAQALTEAELNKAKTAVEAVISKAS